MGELIRSINWDKTPMGNPRDWSVILQSHVSTMLHNKIGMYIAWGQKYTQLYNDAFRPILGADKHPLAMGISSKETFIEIWDTIGPMFSEVMAGKSVGFTDFMVRLMRNGFEEECYFDFSYSPIFIKDGKVGGILVTVIETTEKIKSLRRLEERQRQMDFTIDSAELGTWDLDPKTNKFLGNDRLKSWFGLAANEEIELPLALGAIVDRDRDRVIKAIEAALNRESGGIYDIEYTIYNSTENEYKNVLARGKALFDADGNPNKFSGILQDVTSYAQFRMNLKEAGERFENMANNIPNLVWIAKSDGWIYWYNAQWYQYTGTTIEQMEGWGWTSVHDPKELPRVLTMWGKSISLGEPFEMVFPIKGADGIFRPFLTRVVPLRDAEGKITNWLGTNTDITKQKEAEQLKENFLSTASHELKTPVTSIKAYAQIIETLLQAKGDEKIAEMIHKVIKQVNKLQSIIEDILDFTRLHNDKLMFRYTTFDFNELVEEVAEDMQKISTTHTIITRPGGTTAVYCDRDKIAQVINNLVSNAIKYSPSSDKIILATQLKDDGIQLSVQDFGIGIETEKHSKIFDQFYRVSGKSLSTFPGLGIGLFISSEIINNHGGKIWLNSVLNEGSTFYIWLPTASVADSEKLV